MKRNLRAVASGREASEDQPARNEGMPLDLSWLRDTRVNRSAVERRAATLGTRRTVKKDWQSAWLLKAVSCIDLTTLSGDDTPDRVRRLCAKARQPIRQEILEALGADRLNITVGAICVYHNMIEPAVEALKDSGIPVAAVSAGFPVGRGPMETRIREIEASVAAGAQEIDIVIDRGLALTGDWARLYEQLRSFLRKVSRDASASK